MGETLEKTDYGMSLRDATITDLDSLGDVLILAESLNVILHAMDTLSIVTEALRLKVSWIKINIQKFDLHPTLIGDTDLWAPVTILLLQLGRHSGVADRWQPRFGASQWSLEERNAMHAPFFPVPGPNNDH